MGFLVTGGQGGAGGGALFWRVVLVRLSSSVVRAVVWVTGCWCVLCGFWWAALKFCAQRSRCGCVVAVVRRCVFRGGGLVWRAGSVFVLRHVLLLC